MTKKKILPDQECELLGPVSILIQSLLGLIAVSSLLLKRSYEHPRRPWRVWFFDVSKQVFGALGIHLLNLTVSLLKSRRLLLALSDNGGDDDGETGNQCDWYFLNLLMDTTIGVPILWFCLFFIYQVCEILGIKDIESGNYGKPPRIVPYLKQLTIFFLAVVLMKGIIYLLLYIPIFIMYADWVLSWTDGFPNLQIFLVMLVFPTLLNCFQYYVIDNIIKFPTNL
ncbi:Vacuolar membrane protein [Wickerhamomyces ciferrii]|uniref:Vacuolar membrane protein n=1 Tax=Wickerhamomyces ciferrii (strain ATCC 14091 / BCRC 22168 / CBS 111 / JCM 3599 / NBRC 0793 / NRRL Y-1031 F-60-10) TaxID=1206466 RepID=K0KV73_WICCF|nr:Vacuolar membrane protein [Wickerhamomyces ciferrii]CCH45068.1 Vacuolar membrane protein [Wickerhamomyces ciferrii]